MRTLVFAGIASRTYIAHVLPNAPENMVRCTIDPPTVDAENLNRVRARGE